MMSGGAGDGATARVQALYRYPVKGLSAESLDSVGVEADQTIPFDRAWAIENGPGRFDPDAPRHLPKITFLMLMRDERLATLQSRFEPEGETLTILRAGKQVARGQLSSKLGRQMIEQFLAAYMKESLRGAPRIVSARGHCFSDVDARCLHIVNLASVADLERAAGRKIDPLRFRPNVVIEGLPAWAELGLADKGFKLGSFRLEGFARTQRCAATNVDPSTGARDMAIPAVLQRTWGHSDFGIYARVVEGGRLAVGDALELGA